MGALDDGCGELLAEIDAFYQGFGQPDALTAALRSALLLVPVTGDDRLLTSDYGGLTWICVFTSEVAYARYLADRGEFEHGGFRALLGSRVVDELIPALDRPAGVVVDVAGASPMAFPPMEVRA
ncbi:hypothetical protein FK531_20520 [Rhodococcus spelaei]|uniref:SseB protein N-terminal domain-containing protein n=1 Tax=Rhodococcus spelaei TaxID=2546320 RepID=A0A541B0G5_9NOCA|nr:SseB family protein [Rhodococcus spelaei]TQF65811.1 hypothetical protein FK531_20520 [Rhodococcus spelaei]